MLELLTGQVDLYRQIEWRPRVTVADLREKTRDLEEAIHHRIEDFEGSYQAQVARVLVCEPYHDRDDETSRNQEVKVRLTKPLPEEFPRKEKKILGRSLRKLLREYEKDTGCRVTEVLVGLKGYPVEVRTDVLAYPERLLETRRRALEEDIDGLLCGFEGDTQGQVSRVKITRVGSEEYVVKVRLACSRT
jgi:hypothetical protein